MVGDRSACSISTFIEVQFGKRRAARPPPVIEHSWDVVNAVGARRCYDAQSEIVVLAAF